MPRRFALRLLTAALTAMLLLSACSDDGNGTRDTGSTSGSASGSASGSTPEESETS